MELLWLVPALPLAGFLILFVTQGKLPDRVVAVVGAGSVGLAALVALSVGFQFVRGGEPSYAQHLWTWIAVGDFRPSITLYIDSLALVMTGVITGVGFLIHVFATGYMWQDHEEPKGYSRFFAYMNLFVFAMLMLVLGDNLLVLFLGWEGVGLCSYLLIGFYHRDPANGYAARKAFVVTRVGDTLMALGLFLLFWQFKTLEVQEILSAANTLEPGMATAIGLLLLGGAVGKSAQVPLQTWLPDAMAGPTPVSALIHAATMVTAGVYLIARMQDVYLMSPDAQRVVAVVGLVTLLISSFSALTQTDIKRILAYSTMSQIGYMFMALGVGAWSAAIFHLMTHAFFKALLFLASGSVILALHHEQDIYKMGGLWKKLPVPFWSMAIGSGALVALPFITSGFWSKDAILLTAYAESGWLFWGGGVLAAGMTALYTTRMMIVTFFGETKTEPHDNSKANMWLPLIVLWILSIGGGWLGDRPTASGITQSPKQSYLQSWNFTIERELPGGTSIEIDYRGSKGSHLIRRYDFNQAIRTREWFLANRTAAGGFTENFQSLRPNPDWNAINFYNTGSNSTYNAANVSWRKRSRAGVFWRINYSFSKSIDDASRTNGSGATDFANALDRRNLRLERGRSTWDRRHVFTAVASYNLPLGRGRRWGRSWTGATNAILGGWQLSGTQTSYSGSPFTVTAANADVNLGESQRPHRLRDGFQANDPSLGSIRGSDYPFFDTRAFQDVPSCVDGDEEAGTPLYCPEGAFALGSSGRNILDGPGLLSANIALSKNFQLREGMRLQLRIESFNFLNRTNFIMTNEFRQFNGVGGGYFTRVGNIGRGGGPRIFQYALKLRF